jgi:hypothetical protein
MKNSPVFFIRNTLIQGADPPMFSEYHRVMMIISGALPVQSEIFEEFFAQ